MSTARPEAPVPDRQDEQVPYGKVVAVGLIALGVLIAGSVWATRILVSEQGAISTARAAHPAPGIGEREIGIVNQTLIDQDDSAGRVKARQQKRLSSYGWVDRSQGVVHVPIDVAMDALLREASQ